jgi:Replication Fork Protection Component Swi3
MEETIADDIANLPAHKPKKSINRAQLNESTLINENKGLKKLYTECLKFQVTGDNKNDLNRLLNLYKEWHFGVAPKFEFNYFIQKCQALGSKNPVKAYMARLRKVHSGQATWEETENVENLNIESHIDDGNNLNLDIDQGENTYTGINIASNTNEDKAADYDDIDYYVNLENMVDDVQEYEYFESVIPDLTETKRKQEDDPTTPKKLKTL